LLIGGQESGKAKAGISFLDPRSNALTSAGELKNARSEHTATVLPDGMVLVFGGQDGSGNLVTTAELFDPSRQTVRPYEIASAGARAGHTATLLQDGRLLISGGRDENGLAGDALLWNQMTGSIVHLAGLEHERRGHLSTLLPSGNVLVRGGQGADGSDVAFAEVFGVASGRFIRFDDANRHALPTQALTDRKPEALSVALAATGSKTNSLPVVLFSKPINVRTITATSITLIGRSGEVPITSTPAERGMLLFVHPSAPLVPGADYTLFVKGVSDEQGNAVPFASLHFVTPAVTTADAIAGSGLPTLPSGPASAMAAIVQHTASTQPVDVSALHWDAPERDQADGELWIPEESNLHGKWWSTLPRVPAGKGPSAPPGVTALSGRVLRMNGLPLAGVTLTAQGRTAVTDRNGFFLLQSLQPGATRLDIDGRPASHGDTKYGNYAARVDVATGVTTALPYVIWMTKLDPVGTVRIPSPTTEETVVTSPSLPGLELHLPAGAVIRGKDGNIITELNITPIPTNQPPFPLPDLGVPIYFTIQPGGATIEGFSPEARGARLFYPNFRKEVPYARGTFWNYDADSRGWFIYGSGTISQDARQAIPDPGVVITEFTGAMFNGGGAAPNNSGPQNGDCPGKDANNANDSNGGGPGSYSCGDPLDTYSSQFTRSETDLFLPDVMPIGVRRTYRSFDLNQRMFGVGMTLDYDMFLHSENQYTETDLILPTGKKVHFVRISPGSTWSDAVFTTQAPGHWYGAVISWNGNGWDFKFKDGSLWKFPDNAPIQSMMDRHGNQLLFTRGTGPTGPITRIDSPNGRWVTFQLDPANNNRVIAANDSAGRTVTYAYDASGQLISVTNPNNETHGYTWTANHTMFQVKSAKGDVVLTNRYDCQSILAVVGQTLGDGSTFGGSGPPPICPVLNESGSGGGGPVLGVPSVPPPGTPSHVSEIIDRAGQVRHVEFDDKFHITKDVFPKGTPDEQVTTFTYDPATTLLASITDSLGRVTTYAYDANGNVISTTALAGTAAAVTTSYTYDAFGDVLSSTDPLQRTSTFVYDNSGDLLEVHDPLGNVTTLTYDAQGLMQSVTNALGQTVTLGYDGADLSSMTDPLGRTAKGFHDAAGRLRSVANALGQRSLLTYDGAGRLLEADDPMGNSVKFGYDANGNMISSADQRGNVTTYAYDVLDRRISRTDSLNATESASYTPAGHVATFTARNGQITTVAYDTAARPTLVKFGATAQAPATYESTIAYTYDKSDRLLAVADSASGELDYTYNLFDQVTQETTPLGYVQYDFDSIGRRTQMRPSQQAAVSYAYDGLDRLGEIDNAGDAVHFAYDNLGRYTSVQLRNGITQAYTYDPAGQLSSIVYGTAASTIGDLTYSYDALGRVVAVAGTMAKVNLPDAANGWTYNVNNQAALPGYTYDANGRLTSNGVSTFAWNARDQLTQISGSSNAQFAYDAAGRRSRKSVNGAATQFLYDDANVIQDLADGSSPLVNASYVTGFGTDEVLGRTKGNSKSDYLTDKIGSTVALSDSAASTPTNYSYEAFGKATQSGAPDSNATMFSGREDDATGVMYFRARYYDPRIGRFISEDPLGLAGGLANLYSYTGADPVNNIDPFGLKDWNEQETLGLLTSAFCASTAGRWQGLMNIKHNSQGKFDFSYIPQYRFDTWTRNGVTMKSNEFGNYIAGFGGAAYDRRYRWSTGIFHGAGIAVKLYGVGYHILGKTEAPDDPFDATGFPMITAGEVDGNTFGPVCGCGR
jgi:RHS repeat-associated protein